MWVGKIKNVFASSLWVSHVGRQNKKCICIIPLEMHVGRENKKCICIRPFGDGIWVEKINNAFVFVPLGTVCG